MMISSPVAPAAKPALATAPAATPAPAAPAATPATGTTAPTAPSATPAPGTPAPATVGQPAPRADTSQQAVIDKLMQTSATEAIGEVDAQLAKVASLTVGGGTPEGANGAKVASALLTDASMMLQHAHVKAMEQIRTLAGELHMQLMSSASGLAFMGGQVSTAGQAKEPVKLADIAAGPIAATRATMADVVAALRPAEAPAPIAVPPAAPAPNADGAGQSHTGDGEPPVPAGAAVRVPAPAPGSVPVPGPVPVPAAANGNGGVAGAAVTRPAP